jgi:microcystin-dependent protein
MSDPFIAEIRVFGFNFAPTGWAKCNGQVVPISQNTALFSLLGTTYGGDGKSTFALPNIQAAAAMHPGQGAGLADRLLGEEGGSETTTLLESEIPVHAHIAQASLGDADLQSPASTTALAGADGPAYKAAPLGQLAALAPQAVPPAGGGQPHNNLMPYLTLLFCIALQGVSPTR